MAAASGAAYRSVYRASILQAGGLSIYDTITNVHLTVVQVCLHLLLLCHFFLTLLLHNAGRR